MYCIAKHCIALYCIVLYCVVLYYIIFHHTINIILLHFAKLLNTFRFIGKYLKLMNRLNGASDKERQLVKEFTNRYLRSDGVFVMR